jgi:Lantibiotic dehydratase, N terminus
MNAVKADDLIEVMDEGLVPLVGDWGLWSDFAVRSAGFPVEGLEVFGSDDEHSRLVGVARDAAFREAVTWQSREALGSAVDKLAAGGRGSASRRQRQEEVVASYWQRYCSKNDTIGFFGPLAWGRFAGDGPAVTVRSGRLLRERVVHLEVWAVEAVARAAGLETMLPMGPYPERALRERLTGEPDVGLRERGQAALDRLEAARDTVAAAGRDGLLEALAGLDRLFAELTGREAGRSEEDSHGGRTVVYLDCMRDLDVNVGPAVTAELRATLPPLLESSRWWCGMAYAAGRERFAEIADARGPGPLAPMIGDLLGAAMTLHEALAEHVPELQRRWAALLDGGDETTIARRAADVFADHRAAWPFAVYYSPDVQIAAADTDAIERGEFSVVLGDFHGGTNPLMQGVFLHRHPDPDRLRAQIDADVGPHVVMVPPRRSDATMTGRLFPVFGGVDNPHVVADPPESAPEGARTFGVGELTVADGCVSDRAGSFRVSLADLLWGPIFMSAMRSFDPFGARETGRVTIGRTVLRRATWPALATELPAEPQMLASWAREHGMPRRVFVRSPLQPKPIYVDFESPILLRVLARFLAPLAERAPTAAAVFSEMLPGPEDCWLEDANGRYTSELRVVAVDTSRRPGRATAAPR